MGLPRLLTQSRNDTCVSGKTANACLSARNDDKGLPERVYAMPFFVTRRLPRLAVGKARNDSSI